MPDTRNIGRNFHAVGQSDAGKFPQSRVRFFRSHCAYLIATPRFRGEEKWADLLRRLLKPNDKAGDFVFALALLLGFFSNWLNVGIYKRRPLRACPNYNPEQRINQVAVKEGKNKKQKKHKNNQAIADDE